MAAKFPEAVRLVCMRPASLNSDGRVLHDLVQTALPETYPDACRDLIYHLLGQVDERLWGTHDLVELVGRLMAVLGVASVRVIVERAVEKGIPEAASWIH